MAEKRFEDYFLSIIEEVVTPHKTFYRFKSISGREYPGCVNPSLDELPRLELKEFLDQGSLDITQEFVRLIVKVGADPEAIFIYLKPFESINRIQELPKAESKPRVIENFDINLPETSICVGNSYYGQKVVQIFRYHRQNKQIICNYDLPINDDFIIWLFKEVEREFLGFVEAYEEERRRQQENEEEFVSIPHR